MLNHDRREITLAGLLTGLAGYVDAIGFLHLGGFFVSFMSGNTTRAGVALAEGSFRQFGLAAGLIGAFVGGVVLGSLVGHRSKQRRRWAVLSLVAAVLIIAATLNSIRPLEWSAPPIIAVAMGAQNALFERDEEVSIGLTFVTGTLVKLGQHLSRLIDGERNFSWLRYFALWAGLAVGTFLGALASLGIGLASLWIAAAFASVTCFAVGRLDT